MATRVKKLARQLERAPVEVLGLLHAMGYVRYKSAQDMVGDDVIARLRREMRDGLRPLELEVRRVPIKAPPAPEPVQPEVKVAQVAAISEEVEALRAQLAQAQQERDDALGLGQARQATLDVLRAELVTSHAAQGALQAQTATLIAERDALQATMEATEAAVPAENTGVVPASDDSLLAALQARGLRGDDEFERAVGALAGKRVLRELLSLLTVRNVDEVGRVLDRRLLLVGAAVDESITGGAAVVEVAAERAEVPGAAQLERLVARVGEQCLLSGLRRFTVVGVPPLWHRLLSGGLDPRVELRVAHGAERSPEHVRADVEGSDGVVYLNITLGADAEQVLKQAGVWIHRSSATDFLSFLNGLLTGLRED